MMRDGTLQLSYKNMAGAARVLEENTGVAPPTPDETARVLMRKLDGHYYGR